MKTLHATTALIEGVTGLTLLAVPSGIVKLLLGCPLESTASIALGRVAGMALLALGAACWSAHQNPSDHMAQGLVRAMLLYNIGAATILAYSGACSGLVGLALWPAVILHVFMAGWCVFSLKSKILDPSSL